MMAYLTRSWNCSILRTITIMLSVLIIQGCGPTLLKAKRTSLLDEYFVLNRKSYSRYINVLVKADQERGKYVQSNDTIYLLGARKKKSVEWVGYAIIDTAHQLLTYYRTDTPDSSDFRILYYHPALK